MRLAYVARGEGPDEVLFVAEDGAVLIAHGHGLHAEEAARTREALLALLADSVPVRTAPQGA